MQLNYNGQAAEKGVYIIGSCGFDSIPADMGVLYTRDQFKGTCVHLGIDNETHLDSSQSDVVFAICSSAGILTTVESFLTIKSGPDVSSFSQHLEQMLYVKQSSSFVSLQLFTKWRKLFI